MSSFDLGNDDIADTSSSLTEAVNLPPSPTETAVFLPPLTPESGLPPTVVRGPWTADLNSIRTTTISPHTSPSTTSTTPSTVDSNLLPSPSKTLVFTPQTQVTLEPVAGAKVVSTTQLWAFAAGAGGLMVLGLIIWHVRRQRKRHQAAAVRNAARARHLLRSNSGSDALSDARTDATIRRDIGPSALRPLPTQSNFQKSQKRRLDLLADRDPRVRWAGLSATTSEANVNLEQLATSTIGRAEFFDASVRSDESEFDLIRREAPVNEAFRLYRLDTRNRSFQKGLGEDSVVSISDFEPVINGGPAIFVPDLPAAHLSGSPYFTATVQEPTPLLAHPSGSLYPTTTVRQPTPSLAHPPRSPYSTTTAHPPTPSLAHPSGSPYFTTTVRPPTPPLAYPAPAQLRSESGPRRLREIQPHEIRDPGLWLHNPVHRSGPMLLAPQIFNSSESLRSRSASLVDGDSVSGGATHLAPQVYGGREGIRSRSRALSSGSIEVGVLRNPVLSVTSGQLSQVDFGAWTEPSLFTDTEISDDPWREEAMRNRRSRR